MLNKDFFDRDTKKVAIDLLGKIIRHKVGNIWLSARIIETEAYYVNEKGSHAYEGFTQKRKALFMQAGTVYMYYSRGKDSFNISTMGKGNAVLIKSGFPYLANDNDNQELQKMQKMNPGHITGLVRPIHKLCNGQTLLCKSLGITVKDWDQKQFQPNKFFIEDTHNSPEKIVQTTRLGIRFDKDPHFLYRFIDYSYVENCTKNPLTIRKYSENQDYFILDGNQIT